MVEGERLFFYYSGHGVRVPDTNGDEPDGWDDSLVPHDFSKVRPFLDDEIRAFRARVPATAKMILVFDCCHGGGMPRAPMSTSAADAERQAQRQVRYVSPLSRDLYSHAQLQQLQRHKQSCGIEAIAENFICLAACGRDEQAYEQPLENRRHGVFTYALGQILKARGPTATAHEIERDSQEFISRLGIEFQVPCVLGNRAYYDIPLFD
ncbi:MAG: caspase family protein [Planctomycetota bacterium]|nr:caspase family protein [Planctomycetota bacterium]